MKKRKERDKSCLGEQGTVAAFSLGIFAESEKEVRTQSSFGISRRTLLGSGKPRRVFSGPVD